MMILELVKNIKIITFTNRIDEHTADYSKDYIKKSKNWALKEKQIKEIAKWTEEKLKKPTSK